MTPQEITISRRQLLASASVAAAATAGPPLLRPAAAREASPVARPMKAAAAMPAAQLPGAEGTLAFLELRGRVERRMEELRVPGVALGVIADGAEHAVGLGVTSLDHPSAVDVDTLFQIGSTTKTYTGTALMRLVERGDVDLEAPVRTYLPEFRVADEAASEAVLVRHLATHTAGWYGDRFDETGDGDDALAAFVAAMADLPQIAPLGRYLSYNNASLSALGRVIEVVTGQTYEAAVGELVLAPLGLERNAYFTEQVMTQEFAVGHTANPEDPTGPPVVVPVWALPRSVFPAGGIISSVVDQLRYARFHLGDGTVDGVPVLSPASLEAMRTPQGPGGSFGATRLDGVGVTWLLSEVDGERVVSHGGSTYGQQSSFLMVPGRGFAVTLLSNADAGATLAEEASRWAMELFLGLPPSAPEPVEVAAERLAEYVGDYASSPDLTLTVAEADGGLTLAATPAGADAPILEGPLPPVGDDLAAFDVDGLPSLTDFVRDEAGAVGWIRFSGRLYPRLP